MSRLRVAWDDERTTVSTERFRVTIRTGMTVLARNAFTVLAMTAPLAKVKLWDAMLELAGTISNIEGSGALDAVGVPAFLLLDAYGVRMAVGYGFVPSGVRQRGQIHGEFRLVFMTRDEVPDSLTDVFGLESLWKEVEPCSTANGNSSETRSSRRKKSSTISSSAVATR